MRARVGAGGRGHAGDGSRGQWCTGLAPVYQGIAAMMCLGHLNPGLTPGMT